ncbi:MAG: bifunctional DNA primase/polymerase [Terracidiphilus sp.]
MTGGLARSALEYAARGWLVIPLHSPTARGCTCGRAECESPGKHPRTAHGLKDASRDPATIREWWERWPDANIGILTGPESGILVLDVDGKRGEESLIDLERRGCHLPDTYTVRTGGGGQHLYFLWPQGADARNSQSKIAPGLDFRGQGGIVVAPPSLHASGGLYEVNESAIPPVPCPEWLPAKSVERFPAGEHPERAALHLLKGSNIPYEDVPWILENHIPDKTVFGIHGRPGEGKTRVAMRIAADLSCGRTPFTGRPCTPRNVLILSNEDAPGRIRSLYEAMGGELERLFVENTDDAWWLGDRKRLDSAIAERGIGFVVVDSLASHSGKTDLNAHADTTRLLVPLRALAERHNSAVAVIHHLNKLITADHIAKVAGSIGITASFRHNLHVVPDLEDTALRLLVNGKTNLAPPDVPALRFALSPCEWRGISALTIAEAYSLATNTEERPGKAVGWLQEALADGEWHDTGNLIRQAKSEFDLSRRSIYRAAERLKVERRKEGFGGPANWRLLKRASAEAIPAIGTHGTYGTNGDSNNLRAKKIWAAPYVPFTGNEASQWHSWDGACGGLLQ